MKNRARAGLDAFLSRRTPPATHMRGSVPLPDGPLPLVVRRHPTARQMTLRLSPDGGEARVSIPRFGALDDGVRFATARADWLAAQRAKRPQPLVIADGAALPFRGRVLRVTRDAARPRRPVVDGEVLWCGGSADGIEARIRRWMEEEALRLMTADVADFCARAAIPAPPVRLSRAQRRWGSCARDGTIRLNWRLVMAEDAVRRSVAAHEVAHLVHFDHSPAFHALHARIFDGDLARADRWLNEQGRTLYAAFG
ncbi:M48 family metallopeptidase [Croceicoccus hydrothermalis]|uniref:M48 family metallopeptidase n=1 Tax=Croceicoccus hydrothermalis TaxID=2867964 RepID=UPI001EFBD031|nr:SprT family zinc-dependent metalloprotease [Croceicoccus hydrothermalis]